MRALTSMHYTSSAFQSERWQPIGLFAGARNGLNLAKF